MRLELLFFLKSENTNETLNYFLATSLKKMILTGDKSIFKYFLNQMFE
tara:strand:- start:759 stop:902 length:144 start_codon:yes stop_codon:yes gene_type:complete